MTLLLERLRSRNLWLLDGSMVASAGLATSLLDELAPGPEDLPLRLYLEPWGRERWARMPSPRIE